MKKVLLNMFVSDLTSGKIYDVDVPNDIVLVKGSQGMRMELLLPFTAPGPF